MPYWIRVDPNPIRALQVALVVKNGPANAGDVRDTGLIPGSRIPWRRKWQPTPVFLPGKSHGQRRLAGYTPCCKESDTAEVTECACTLTQYDWCPYRKRETWHRPRRTEEDHATMEARQLQAQEHWGLLAKYQKLGRGILLCGLHRELGWLCWQLDTELPLNCEISFCCSTSPSS